MLQLGCTRPICEHILYNDHHLLLVLLSDLELQLTLSPESDVSRNADISVSAYLRTQPPVPGDDQHNMGNDLLMCRLDLTPVLDGPVSFGPGGTLACYSR